MTSMQTIGRRVMVIPKGERLFGSKAFAKHPYQNPSSAKDMASEVKFKYPQPFTWAQVMDLDIGTISQGTPRETENGATGVNPVN